MKRSRQKLRRAGLRAVALKKELSNTQNDGDLRMEKILKERI